jgi:hypothetical protein
MLLRFAMRDASFAAKVQLSHSTLSDDGLPDSAGQYRLPMFREMDLHGAVPEWLYRKKPRFNNR